MKTLKDSELKKPNYDHVFGDKPNENKKSIRIMYDIMKEFKWQYLESILAYIVKNIAVWVIPVLTAEIIDIISMPDEDPSAGIRRVLIYGLIILILLVQNSPTNLWYATLSNKILRNSAAGLRCSLVRKLQKLSITYHKQMESGKLQSKFIRDVDSVNSLISILVVTVTTTMIGLIVSIGISLYNSPLMTLFFILVVPLNIIIAKGFTKYISKRSRAFRIENENVSSLFTSILRMLPVTRAHGLEDKEMNNFDSGINRLTRAGLEADRINAYFGAWIWITSNILSCTCLVLCAIMALKGKMTPGNVVLYQSLFAQINGNVSTLVNVFPSVVSGFEGVKSVSEVMTSDDIERDGSYDLPEIDGKIDFNHVDYAYPDNPDVNVVTDFDLHVKEGECIAFVGSSGSGKTTVINMIIGFLRATRGTVMIDDEDINTINIRDYRHHISVVPQNGILFPGTIRENITYGLDHYTEEQLQAAIEMANISEFLPELPNGIDTQVGEEGDKLSGGQRQRITIARALIRDPSILILDEATSALDNVSEYHVQKAIEKVTKGRTTFIVAHRLSTIRNADRIVVMSNGKIAECGTYEELMALKGRFYELKSLSDMATKSFDDTQFIND